MKLWLTRPSASEVYMGGLRHVNLWVSKPVYDYRLIERYKRINTINNKEDGIIYIEMGWVSTTVANHTRAKPFLKQNEEVKNIVWNLIYESVKPKDFIPESMNDDEYIKLVEDPDYEGKCNICYKDFLIEIDLATNSVYTVKPEYFMEDKHKLVEKSLSRNHYLDDGYKNPHNIVSDIGKYNLVDCIPF